MIERFQWKIRTWLLLGLVPSLLGATAWMSWSIFSDVEQVILEGFDRKLLAVSTTTAAFIRADDHLQLMARPSLAGLCYDPRDDVFYALDTAHHRLLRIRAGNGSAEPGEIAVPVGLHGLAFDSVQRRLISLEGNSGRVVALDPADGRLTVLHQLDRPVLSLTDGPTPGTVILTTDQLLQLDLATRALTPRSPLGSGGFSGLTYDAELNLLWGIERAARRLVSLDPATGRVAQSFPLDAKSPLPVDLAFDSKRRQLLGALSSFLLIDRKTGRISQAHFVPAFGREASPLYQHYVQPMRDIQQQLDLTFLYSEVFLDRTRIIYGLDATTGEKHSPLHSEDVLREEHVEGIRNLLIYGTTFVGPVTAWEPWGLIKTADAPILDATGRTIGAVGADVDISLITTQSHRALVIALAVGGLGLAIAGALSLRLSLRLIQPLGRIKGAALEAAAGRFERPLAVDSPTELAALAHTFNEVRDTLRQNLELTRSSMQQLLARRHLRELRLRLAAQHRLDDAGALGPRLAASAPAETGGGCVRHAETTWLWLAREPAGSLAALRLRSDLARTLQPCLASAAGRRAWRDEMQPWLGAEVAAALAITDAPLGLDVRIAGAAAALGVRGTEVTALDLTSPLPAPLDAVVLSADHDFLRTIVAPALAATARQGLPNGASAVLAALTAAMAAHPLPSPMIVLTEVARLSPA